MKKRSLFAAVAMLIVSAIVLTSATYAWFAVSEDADVDPIYATVSNNKGAILLLPNVHAKSGAVASNHLSSSDFDTFPSTLDPVSVDVVSGTFSAFKAAYDGRLFTQDTATENEDYIKFGFQVQYKNVSVSTAAVNLTPSLYTPENGQSPNFGYALVRVKIGSASSFTDYWYRYDGSNTYEPLKALPAAGVVDNQEEDATGVGIVNGGSTFPDSTGYTLGEEKTTFTNSGGDILLWDTGTAVGTHTADVVVYLWAEGNDPDCVGAVSASTVGISFDVG